MRALTAALVTLTLTAGTLSGCGQAVSPSSTQALMAGAEAQAAHQASASQLAREFAEKLSAQYGQGVSRRDTSVVLTVEKTKTHYEFARTPKTGKVRVSGGEYTFEVEYAKLIERSSGVNADVLPAMLVPIAIQVGLGGALGLANYWIHHRGDKFKRDEAIKASVEGMLAALIPITREVKYVQFLVPLALVLLKSAKSLNYKDLAKAAMEHLDDIVKVLIAIVQDMKVSSSDAAPVAAAN